MVLFSLAFGFLPYSKAKDHEELAKLQNNQPLLEFNHEDSEVKILLENLLLSDPNSRYFECEQTADLDPFLKVPTFFDELQTYLIKSFKKCFLCAFFPLFAYLLRTEHL